MCGEHLHKIIIETEKLRINERGLNLIRYGFVNTVATHKFPFPSIPAPRPTQPPLQWVPGVFLVVKGLGCGTEQWTTL
jgi:hypothetical protein